MMYVQQGRQVAHKTSSVQAKLCAEQVQISQMFCHKLKGFYSVEGGTK